MTEKQIKELLMQLVESGNYVVEDFPEYGVLTTDEGFVLQTRGQEFAITIQEI